MGLASVSKGTREIVVMFSIRVLLLIVEGMGSVLAEVVCVRLDTRGPLVRSSTRACSSLAMLGIMIERSATPRMGGLILIVVAARIESMGHVAMGSRWILVGLVMLLIFASRIDVSSLYANLIIVVSMSRTWTVWAVNAHVMRAGLAICATGEHNDCVILLVLTRSYLCNIFDALLSHFSSILISKARFKI
eukprot:SAG11_NODE_4643_length_1824_cov_1.106667_3_plen_191_part_00